MPLHGRRGPGHGVGGDHRQRARRTWRWWRCPPRWRNVDEIADWISARAPAHRGRSRIRTGRCRCTTSVADLVGRDPRLRWRCAAARCACSSARSATAATDDRGRWYTRRVVDPTVLLDELESRGWLPAIYFIFSRAGCERAMETVLAEGKPAAHPRAAAAGGRGHRARPPADNPDHRGIAAQPDHLPGPRAWAWGSTTRASCPA